MNSNLYTNGFSLKSSARPTVLVVDDEPVIRELCARALSDYRVVEAENLEQALFLYERELCDLVLSDVMMPGGSGIDLLKKIKEIDPGAVVMVMTGFSDREVILNSLKEGADDFISKPLNLLQLKTSVSKALARKRLRDEVANLKRLDHVKSNFLSLVSHKLRTPITSVSLILQNLQKGVYGGDAEEFQEAMRLATDEMLFLERMVSDLLVFSKVLSVEGDQKENDCDLNLMIRDILMSSREIQEKPGIDVQFRGGDIPLLRLDRTKICFALQQIIENAFKFTAEGGHISIVSGVMGDRVQVVVSDTGIGMAREEIPKVFEKFYQIDPHNTGQVRGFGLGLFYAREFIHQHGGTISIDSDPGVGTAVTVTLQIQ